MDPDDHVCLCFRVSLRKLRSYMARTEPRVPSQIADCLGAGTGCRWCVPFLCRLHAQWRDGQEPDLPLSPETYASRRQAYRASGAKNDALPDLPEPPLDAETSDGDSH